MRHRSLEVLAASAIAVCCLALAIHPNLRSTPADAPAAPLDVQLSPSTPGTAIAVPAAERPRIDVVFVLDTTGSMSGLLEGAKQKIWAVANRLASGQPQPELRIGLVAYRDLGDDYVTKRLDFSSDMDAVYAELLSYQASGGGDHPEHVAKGLDEALHGMQWSSGPSTLRLVFLVGDAPPHEDYRGQQTTEQLSARAAELGIVINTIQCGSSPDTAEAWRRIASKAGGEYTSIAQDGGVVTVATPFDQKLWELGNQLNSTVVTYGGQEARRSSMMKLGNRASMSVSAAAEAASYSAKTARMNAEDLLGALDGGQNLAEIPVDQLPANMQTMSAGEQQAYLSDVRSKRNAVNEEIRAVSAQRDAYLRDAERAAGAGDGFDGKVTDTLRRQASAIGVVY